MKKSAALDIKSAYIAIPIVVETQELYPVNDAALEEEAKRILDTDESEWYTQGSQANWFYGLGALAVNNTPGTFRVTNGVHVGNSWSPRYYRSGWRGGSRAGIKTYNIARIGKALGYTSIAIGVILDGYGVKVYIFDNPNSLNAVHPAKAIFNLGMSIYGIYNPTVSVPFFFIDSFYPGGWNQALKDRNDLEERNQRIVPGFRLNPKEY